tara:strand:+ start:708 stop:1040 length:333 start_codon:yes stop_codon:yes gene_type:complete
MQLPVPGDLVSVDKSSTAILVGGDLKTKRWSYSLISIDPGNTGLVLEVYNPSSSSRKTVIAAAEELLKEQGKREPDEDKKPKEIVIMVMTIGTNIVEIVYDASYMTIISL